MAPRIPGVGEPGGNSTMRTSLEVQWLRLHASIVGGMGLIPGPGAKVLHDTQ